MEARLTSDQPPPAATDGNDGSNGGDAQPEAPTADDRAALVAILTRVAPAKVANTDAIMSKFAGDRNAMFKTLAQMYPGDEGAQAALFRSR